MSSTDPRRTFVLVHGSWTGGWIWSRLAPLLEAAGHTVHAPTLPGLAQRRDDPRGAEIGLGAHIEDLIGYLKRKGLERVTLVGHSYGGMVITGVAGRAPHRLSALAYLDAFVPKPGQSCFDLLPWLADAFAELTEDGGKTVQPLDPTALGVDDAGDADWLRVNSTPMPLRTHQEPLPGPAHANDLPRMFVRCLRFEAFAGTAAEFKAHGLPSAELDSHHYVQVSRPTDLADLLLTGVPARTETTT
ncbi:alpha/beta fold hydrolase [Spirillospora sp. CA-255316]